MGLSNDLTLSCSETNRAGIARIFLSEACNVTSFTADSSSLSFSAVTMHSTANVWYEYEAEFETKSLNIEGSNESGTPTFTNTLEAKILGLDRAKLQRIQDFIDARKLVAIFESTNLAGTYKRAFVIGWDNILGVDAAGKPNVSGAIEGALDGDNSLTFSLMAKHAELIREYRGTIASNGSGTVTFGS